MAKLDFCCSCGCWIAAGTGTMRKDSDGEVEIICTECLLLERGQITVKHDANSGHIT